MYFPKISKTKAQLEVMISVLQNEYGAKDDNTLAILMAKYFEVDIEDAKSSIQAYRAMPEEDYEMQSKKIEYAGI